MEHDKIRLRGLEFYGYHGVLPEENTLGQRFVVDVDLFLDLREAGLSDRLDASVSYAEVYNTIKDCVLGNRYELIESLAESIAGEILAHYDCFSVRVEVHKPQAPIAGIFRDISIEIWREKKNESIS